MDSFDEKQTLLELSHGSEAAFEKIYNLYSDRIYFKISRLLKSEVVADDVLQDVFLTIWNNRSKISLDKSFCSYLFCITANKCYDYFRIIKRDKDLIKKLPLPSIYSNSIEKSIDEQEAFEVLYNTIELLPQKRKFIFRLCKIECKTYTEVSLQLGISLSTISDHIVKANHFIRTQIIKGDHVIIDDFLQK